MITAEIASERPEISNRPTPQVSVIMPVLNAMPFLKDSIDSILSQSFSQFEFIIVDTGSTDGSREYAESVLDPRIRVLTETHRGAAHAINAGIVASRAELLAVMDADDISTKDRLSIQLAYMREHPDVVLLGTRFSFLIGNKLVPVAPPLMDYRQIRRALLQGISVVSDGTSMFRADAAKKIGGHRLNGPAHDFDFFLRMSEVGIVHNLPVTLYHYRLHTTNSTALSTAYITEHKMFAVACAIAREAGVPEPDFADFRRQWRVRPLVTKLADQAREISARLYRDAIFQRASGKLVSPGLSVICSAILNPRLAIWRVKRQLSMVSLPAA
jgi:glycosyltransferase involved in cell wall biosynthesis